MTDINLKEKALLITPMSSSMAWLEGVEVGRLLEREECAKICESLWGIDGSFTAAEFASAIRNHT
jgi:hypothetical protein